MTHFSFHWMLRVLPLCLLCASSRRLQACGRQDLRTREHVGGPLARLRTCGFPLTMIVEGTSDRGMDG